MSNPESNLRWRLKQRAAGLCQYCGRKPPRKGKSACEDCHEAHRVAGLKWWRANHEPRSAVVDGKRRYRCRKCNGLGHQAKTCGRSAIAVP